MPLNLDDYPNRFKQFLHSFAQFFGDIWKTPIERQIEMVNWDPILRVQAFVELSTSIICFAFNIYFSCRFGRLTKFSTNLRVLLVFAHVVTAICTLLHPILLFVPEDMYSLKNGQYFNAFLVYGMYFVIQLCVLLMDTKYMMIAVERRVAFQQRVNYENRDSSLAFFMIGIAVFVFSISIFIKAMFILWLYPQNTIDYNLSIALNLDRTSLSLFYVNVVAEVCWLYGVVEFTRLSKYVRRHWYNAQTLSESYQIKEIGAVVQVLRPIVIAFTLLMCSAGSLMASMQYLHFFKGYPLAIGVTQAIANCVYILIGVYNIFSTTYVLWWLPAMRQIFLDDLRWLLCRRRLAERIQPIHIDWVAEREEHFVYLQSAWR